MRDSLAGMLWALGMICLTLSALLWLYVGRTYKRMMNECQKMTERMEELLERSRAAALETDTSVEEVRQLCRRLSL